MTNGPLTDGLEALPDVPLATWVRFQLGTRHFPPIRPENDAAAILAVEACAAGRHDTPITLWNGRTLMATEICDDLHLWPLVDLVENDAEEG